MSSFKFFISGCLLLILIFSFDFGRLSGHSVTFPAYVSGEVVYARKSGRTVLHTSKALDADKLKAVTVWLEDHKRGWKPALYTTSRINERTIVLKDADGRQTILIFLNRRMVLLIINNRNNNPDGGVQTFLDRNIEPLLQVVQ